MHARFHLLPSGRSSLTMIGLALKMLFGDTAKYLMLIAGLFLATFVRSVSEVAWAMPVFSGIQRVRMDDGSFKAIQLVGIDAASLAGAPTRILEGTLTDLRLPNAVIVDQLAVERLSKGRPHPLTLGDTFEINDIEARVVGICEAKRSFTGGPYVWTTYERAPPSRKMLSAVIAGPIEGVSVDEAAAAIEKATGLKAFVNRDFGENEKDFNTSTIWWYVRNTGIPVSFGTTVVIGLIVGIAIACQTFYAFVLDNLMHLGALKAMGTSSLRLSMMLIVQAFTVGFIGFGLGLAASAMFAAGAIERGQPPVYLPWIIPVATFGVILAIFRLSRFEPAMVFRA